MELNLVMTIVARSRQQAMEDIVHNMKLPFAMGACKALGGNIMLDAFGLVAMVAMMPLITVQIMGLIYVIKTKHAAEVPEYPYADDDVIELWEG